jgi:hypothetical protein
VPRSVHFIINLYKFCTYPSPVHLNNYISFGANWSKSVFVLGTLRYL